MQLTGTIQERVDQAIAFAKAHRTEKYDHEKFVNLYKEAGVPYTEAAEKFCREWCGVLEKVKLYPDSPNVVGDDGSELLSDIDFSFRILTDADDLRYWYDPDYTEGDYCDDCAIWIRENCGAETVPVASGGYYYPDKIWISPDGKLVTIFPDDGPCHQHIYNNLDDFLHEHLDEHCADKVEMVLVEKRIEGTLDERIATVIEFAKTHGGFRHCRLFADFYNRAPLDLSKLTAEQNLSDEAAAALVLEILQDNTPDYWNETTLPDIIQFVEE
ncbi:MAG: hypothetical protein II956_11885 [Bacteroidales bacterium]|nr:hypothetical protein [Bacteroidales bacterium]